MSRHVHRVRLSGLIRISGGALVALLAGCETIPPPLSSVEVTPQTEIVSSADPSASDTDQQIDTVESEPLEITELNAPRPDTGFYSPGSDQFTRTIAGDKKGEPEPGSITLNFQNVDLLEVVKVILGDLLGANYVVDPRVRGSATLQTSRPVSKAVLLPTLEMLLRMNGAVLVMKREGLYLVAPRDAEAPGLTSPQLGNSSAPLPAGYAVQIVPLDFISAAEMQSILAPMANPGAIIRVDSRRNLLILSGSSDELRSLADTIEIFDVDWLSGMSVALITPNFIDAQTLGDELSKVFSDPQLSPWADLLRFVPIERINGLLVITPRRQVLDRVRDFAVRLDQDPGIVGRRLFVYNVQNGKAVDLAAVLNDVFGTDGPTSPPAPELAPGLEPIELVSQEIVTPESEAALASGYTEAAPTPPIPASTGSAGIGLEISENNSIRIIPDQVNNALLIMGTAKDYKLVRDALLSLDVVPLQVLIEVTIAEITLDGDLQYGLEWFFKNNNLVSGTEGSGLLDLGAVGLRALTPGFSYSLTDAAGRVRAVLSALASDSKLKVVSSPSLMVLNNQTATIEVGDQVPITTQQQQATVADSTIVNSIEFRDTGVLLTVTPRVNSGGLVSMEVQQEVSDVAESTANTLTPTIQQRKISSTVAVQSGDTVVLGGLIRENRTDSSSGIPVLYKLPIVGPLFGTTNKDARRTELVVLITPRAVVDRKEAQRITEEFRSKMESLRSLTEPYTEH